MRVCVCVAAQLGKHVLASMDTASSGAMVDGRVAPAASPQQVTSAASATIAKINTLKSGQLKEILRSLDLEAKGSTADLQKRLLQAAASSGLPSSGTTRCRLAARALELRALSTAALARSARLARATSCRRPCL